MCIRDSSRGVCLYVVCAPEAQKGFFCFPLLGLTSRRISQLVCARVRAYAWCSSAWLLYGPSATYGSSELLLPPALRDANGSRMLVLGCLERLSLCLSVISGYHLHVHHHSRHSRAYTPTITQTDTRESIPFLCRGESRTSCGSAFCSRALVS